MTETHSPMVVIGGGVIGLSVAWRLARAGKSVSVYERNRAGAGTSRVAAGMLAPVAETGFDDRAFTAFGQKSLLRYPSFLAELEADSGTRVAFDARGTLVVAIHRDDVAALRRTCDYRLSIGLPVEWLTGSQAREIEPVLTPRVSAAMWIPGDGHVDTRALVDALAEACRRRGVALHEETPVTGVVIEDDRVKGVRTRDGVVQSGVAVVAAGAWSAHLDGIPEDALPPVRPVKGQILRLMATPDFALAHAVRAPRAYLVPRADGTVVVGATQEEAGFDMRPTAGGVREILDGAWEAVPSIHDLPLLAVDVGLRPGARDHRPVIGPTRVHGLVMATGHFRHGILLAPATADVVCEGLLTGDYGAAAFSPARFATA